MSIGVSSAWKGDMNEHTIVLFCPRCGDKNTIHLPNDEIARLRGWLKHIANTNCNWSEFDQMHDQVEKALNGDPVPQATA